MNHVMELTPLVVDNDIPDAIAAEIINEQLEAAAVAEQDAAYTAEIAAKCAAISERGLQIVSELRVGDRLYSWHKAHWQDTPTFHDTGVVMTPIDEYGRFFTQPFGVYGAPMLEHVQDTYYVQRSVYQWNSANTRFTEDLAARPSPADESVFMDSFMQRLNAVIDVLAPEMLEEGNERRRAFAEMRDNDIRQQVIDSK